MKFDNSYSLGVFFLATIVDAVSGGAASTPVSTSSSSFTSTTLTNVPTPLQKNTLWDGGWIRTNWLSSLIHDDHIYLSGGGTTHWLTTVNGTIITSQSLGSMLRIDLKSPWTPENVIAKYADKPTSYPFARGETMWTDGSHIYTYGGIRYFVPGCYSNCTGLPWQGNKNTSLDPAITPYLQSIEQRPWRIPIDSFNARDWEVSPHQPPHDIAPIQGSLGTTYKNKYYSLGGFNGWPYTHYLYNQMYKSSGIVSWNLDGTAWQNKSSSEYGPAGWGAIGKAVAAPFGPEGVILFLGGYFPRNSSFLFAVADQPLQDLSEIQIYDIRSGQFTTQKATGSIPEARWNHCAVGVSETGTGTFDIYIHGGNSYYTWGESPIASLGKFYVLSLPSFVWTELPNGGSAKDERAAHSCQVAGESQMLMIGGINPTDTQQLGSSRDPWPNGIGIFDLNEWKFKNSYNPKTSPYKRASSLAKVSKHTPFPKEWNSNLAEMLFHPSAKPYNISQIEPAPKESQNKNSDGTNVGAIAGGVVGGIVGIAIVLGIIFFFWRRRRNASQKEPHRAEKGEDDTKPELPGHEAKGAALLSSDQKPIELNAEEKPLPPAPPYVKKEPIELGLPHQAWELSAAISRKSSSTCAGDETSVPSHRGSISQTPIEFERTRETNV